MTRKKGGEYVLKVQCLRFANPVEEPTLCVIWLLNATSAAVAGTSVNVQLSIADSKRE